MQGEQKRPSLFPSDERIAELTRNYEAGTHEKETGKTLQLNTAELKYQKYLLDMKRKIEFYWDYPALAARNGWQGSLFINFTINRDGTVSGVRLERSSGYPMLDDAAITAIRLAAPFPPFPADFTVEDLSIKGQFQYHIVSTRGGG
ncbi:MAG: energy transducer TonB [Thermodesulfobacteriota bacterium]|nr:MAG: energy transducer TonB [Thermodesulfobacteriota bacterium]